MSTSETTHGDGLNHAIRLFVIKDLYRIGVAYIEDVDATVVASSDNDCPLLRKLHHFDIPSAVRNFECSRWRRSVDRIQIVSGGHIVDHETVIFFENVQVPTESLQFAQEKM